MARLDRGVGLSESMLAAEPALALGLMLAFLRALPVPLSVSPPVSCPVEQAALALVALALGELAACGAVSLPQAAILVARFALRAPLQRLPELQQLILRPLTEQPTLSVSSNPFSEWCAP